MSNSTAMLNELARILIKEPEMDKNILVTYASKYGATQEIAEKIGEVLRQAGLQPDVIPVDGIRILPHTRQLSWAARSTLVSGKRKRLSFYEAMRKPG